MEILLGQEFQLDFPEDSVRCAETVHKVRPVEVEVLLSEFVPCKIVFMSP